MLCHTKHSLHFCVYNITCQTCEGQVFKSVCTLLVSYVPALAIHTLGETYKTPLHPTPPPQKYAHISIGSSGRVGGGQET